MWLINVSTLSLELFYGENAPEYAILSHTWHDQEITFQEFQLLHKTSTPDITSKTGYQKVVDTCNQTKKDGLSYVWIDTCCIDKTSSAELTEAINSMFAWYRNSRICYVYLGDVNLELSETTLQGDEHFDAMFRECRWLTRGWCLQELLAPRHLRFYNKHWHEIGEKGRLSHIISEISGLPESLLTNPPSSEIDQFPIATRISWIAKRETTRVEDMAYSLLGILNINMPMLYGEGQRAFMRLQEEVIRRYNDLSIFSWAATPSMHGESFLPILAPGPTAFIDHLAYNRPTNESSNEWGNRLGIQFSLTNQGVVFPNIKLYSQHQRPPYRHQYILFLHRRSHPDKKWSIMLQKVGSGLFVRLNDDAQRKEAFKAAAIMDPSIESSVCILNYIPPTLSRQLQSWERYAVRLRWKRWNHQAQKYWHIRAVEPHSNWDLNSGQFLTAMTTEQYMYIEFVPGTYKTNPNFEYFVMVIKLGPGSKRDPRDMSVRIISSRLWPGVNATPFKFTFKENLALRALPPKAGDPKVDRISMVGFDITMTVSEATVTGDIPIHMIYLDWEETQTFLDKLTGGSQKESPRAKKENVPDKSDSHVSTVLAVSEHSNFFGYH